MVKIKLNFWSVLCIPLVLFSISCSKNSDGENAIKNDMGPTKLTLEISGTVINKKIDIVKEELTKDDYNIAGHIYNEESAEGTQKVASLFFTHFFGVDGSRNVEMVIPAQKGEKEIGTLFPNPTTLNGEPIFYMEIDLKESDYALYDNNNDGKNDANRLLRAKAMGVTITELEETYNAVGILTMAHIKGSFQGTGFLTAYTGPTTNPEELPHNISGKFEYYIPSN